MRNERRRHCSRQILLTQDNVSLSLNNRDEKVSQVELEKHLNDRSFIPLAKTSALKSVDDIIGNWVTIGIVGAKISPKPTKNGDT